MKILIVGLIALFMTRCVEKNAGTEVALFTTDSGLSVTFNKNDRFFAEIMIHRSDASISYQDHNGTKFRTELENVTEISFQTSQTGGSLYIDFEEHRDIEAKISSSTWENISSIVNDCGFPTILRPSKP